ncbi:MAG: hypothetical protein COB85_08365, partial [Bacteroidetes bacterium]
MVSKYFLIVFVFITSFCLCKVEAQDHDRDRVEALIESSRNTREDSSRSFAFAHNAIELARTLGESNTLGRALYNMGDLLEDYDNYSSAISYFDLTIEAYRSAEEFEEIPRILRIIGRMYYSFGDYTKAMDMYMEGLMMYQQLDLVDTDKGWLLRYIGSVYKRQENYEEALDYYGQALDVFEQFEHNDGIASSINNIGIVYGYQGKDSLQIQHYRRALKICEENKSIVRASIIL